MKQYHPLKQGLAAALALAMLGTGLPPAAWAEGELPPDQPQTLSESENHFFGASASAENASLDTASDGSIHGSVDFSGNMMVVKLYHGGSKLRDVKLSSSGSFSFDNLAPGSYVLKFFFWKEGDLPPQKEIAVTVGFNDVEQKQTTPPPSGGEQTTLPPSGGEQTTPPPSGGEQTTPPPSGGEQTTPPPAGGEETTPPPSGGEQTTPPPSGGEETTPPPAGGEETTPPPAGGEQTTPPPAGGEETTPPPSGGEQTTPPPAGGEQTTPPPSGGEQTTPPPTGGEQTTPPPAGGEETTPPPSGGEQTTPPPAGGEQTTPPPAGGEQTTPPPSGGEQTTPPPSGGEQTTPPPAGGEETTPPPSGGEQTSTPEPVFTQINCSATKVSAEGAADGRLSGNVSYTGDSIVVVKLYHANDLSTKLSECKLKRSGESFSFDALAAGSYQLDFHFYGQPAAESRALTIETEKPVTAPIRINRVQGGENQLTVTGTAQAGAQLMVYAEPNTARADVVTAGQDGAFSATLVAEPGIYNRVVAYYVTDVQTAVSAVGYFEVTAPAAPPTLTVDPVDTDSTKVVAKTSPGVKVTLQTPDSAQTLTADSEGIVRFSLPHTYLKDDVFTLIVTYISSQGEQSFLQKVTVQGSAHYSTLEYGSEGDAVTRLTKRLSELGYPVSTTSRYGSTVREAVRLFQVTNGLEADGRANHTTQTVLYSVGAVPYSANKYPTLVRGDRGIPLIYTLQQRLKDLGYYTIKVDGIFGSGTQRAVRLFQQVNGLNVTGKADNATQTLLYSSAAKPLGSGSQGEYKTLYRSNHYNSAVVPLQRRLKSLGYAVGSIDGYFGSQTYRAVRSFQSRNGLTVTGIADPYTQQVLYSSSARRAAGSSSSTGYRLLYWGCRGDDVKRLQTALINAGYKSLVRKADGIYGQWTYDAVRAYQKDHGLAVDGIAGKNTQNKLYGTNY